jgi:hypothetical protein
MADFKDVPKIFEQLLVRLHLQGFLEDLGLKGERLIQKRTREGKDLYGKLFKPYTDVYAEKRAKAGLQRSPVSLIWDEEGGMMRKIGAEGDPATGTAIIDFMTDEKRRLASYHNILGVGKAGAHLRVFWGLNEADKKVLAGFVDDKIDVILAELTAAANAR